MMRTLEVMDGRKVPPRDDEAGFGCLETARGCLPLVSMDVSAKISGLLAGTTVRQTFRNWLEEPLEATYIFPLPDRAAVTSFRMRVGERVVEGELKERAQARRNYRQAIGDGHRAALAEEDRSGTFSIQVGNIPANEDVSVELTLVGPLPQAGGEATFRFPLVVAPRYTTGVPLDGPSVGMGRTADTDEVPDASRVTPPVLLPGFPNPVALSLEVELNPQGLSETAKSHDRMSASLHSVVVEEGPPWKIRLQPGERLNRDFILRFPVAGYDVQTSLVATPVEKAKEATFALTLVPSAIEAGARRPRNVVIVLDRSGSMGGWKMVAARRAAGRIVDSLLEEDRFSVIAFDNDIESPPHGGGGLAAASDRARWRTLEWLGRVDARGGTEMGAAMAEALRLLSSGDDGRQPIVVLVTDGQVAGEDAILRTLKSHCSAGQIPRVHTIGIDRAVNAGFLRRLSDAGGGTCDLVESEDRLDAAMDHIHRGIATAALTDLRLEAVGGWLVEDSLAPARLPDLFADRPITIYGKFRPSDKPLGLRLTGADASGSPWETEVTAAEGPSDTVKSLWGRARVRDLEDRYATGAEKPKALAKEIVEVSLSTHVLSRFTAYVAVDKAEVVNQGGRQRQVVQPVEMPDGWEAMDVAMASCLSASEQNDACMRDVGSPPARLMRSMRLGAAKARSLHSEPEPATIEETLAEIRELLKPFKTGWAWQKRARRVRLERLLDLLRKLAMMIEAEGKESASVVRSLAEEIERVLEEASQGGEDALQADAVNEFLARVRELVGKIGASPKEARREFWT